MITKLDAKTLVPIGLLTGILGAAIWGTYVGTSKLTEITGTQASLVKGQGEQAVSMKDMTAKLVEMQSDLLNMHAEQAATMTDRITMTDMKFWVLSAQQALDRAGIKVELPAVTPVARTLSVLGADGPRK